MKWTAVARRATTRLQRTDATKKKALAGRGGIGASSVEDWKQCPSWLASRQQRRWLQRGFSGQCLETLHRLSCPTTSSQRVAPVVPLVHSARIRRRWIKRHHGVADPPDPQAGGLGFSHGRLVLRPRSKYVRQRAASLHLALSAVFPLHALHGESCLPVWPRYSPPYLRLLTP